MTADPKDVDVLQPLVSARAYDIFERAHRNSAKVLEGCRNLIGTYLQTEKLPAEDICVIAVGSVGRFEALDASDLDLIPILRKPVTGFEEHDAAIRTVVRDGLRMKVSKGEDLTRFDWIDDLTRSERIGGELDDSTSLTKRVLILTEGAHAGGALPLDDVRRALLTAYAVEERTCGRHLLSLSNDVARYYRTLCIEYKAKIDVEGKDWCTRNVKLRHSRKFLYFATMLALAAQARTSAEPGPDLVEKVLSVVRKPPHARLLAGLGETGGHAARRVLEPYAWFLDFMARAENRQALVSVTHKDRYEPVLNNPFPAMKANSDLLHREMITLLDTLDRPTRDRVLDWFLL